MADPALWSVFATGETGTEPGITSATIHWVLLPDVERRRMHLPLTKSKGSRHSIPSRYGDAPLIDCHRRDGKAWHRQARQSGRIRAGGPTGSLKRDRRPIPRKSADDEYLLYAWIPRINKGFPCGHGGSADKPFEPQNPAFTGRGRQGLKRPRKPVPRNLPFGRLPGFRPEFGRGC